MAVPILRINGTDYSQYVLKRTIRLSRAIGSPTTLTFQLRNKSGMTIPSSLQEVLLGMGDTTTNRMFGGHILAIDELARYKNQRFPRFSVSCVDYSWQFDWHTVSGKRWVNTSASTIISDIVSTFCSGFTTTHVAGGLTATDFQSNHEERPSEALNRLMNLIGGSIFVDQNKDVHAFITDEAWKVPTTLDQNNKGFWNFRVSKDRSQVRTRARVVGGAASTTAAVAVGATSIPVDDTTLFSSSGGSVLCGANELTYTGRSTTSGPGDLTGVPSSSTGSVIYAINQGESCRVLATYSDASAASSLATLAGSGDGYVTFSLEDGNMGASAAAAAAQSSVTRYSGTDTRISFECRDLNCYPGVYISVSLTNSSTGHTIASGNFKILSVEIDEFHRTTNKNPRHTVTAGISMVDIRDLLAGGSLAGGGVVTVGQTSGGALVRPVWDLGGSSVEAMQSATPTWVAASNGARRVWIDPVRRGGSVDAVVYVRVRALTAGVSVQARLYNHTTGAAAGTGSVKTSTSWTSDSFNVTLGAGLCEYELQLLPGTANEDVQGVGHVQ